MTWGARKQGLSQSPDHLLKDLTIHSVVVSTGVVVTRTTSCYDNTHTHTHNHKAHMICVHDPWFIKDKVKTKPANYTNNTNHYTCSYCCDYRWRRRHEITDIGYNESWLSFWIPWQLYCQEKPTSLGLNRTFIMTVRLQKGSLAQDESLSWSARTHTPYPVHPQDSIKVFPSTYGRTKPINSA